MNTMPQTRINRVLVVSFVVSFVLGMYTYPPVLFAETVEELRARIDERNAEIAKLEKEIASYQKTLSETSEQSKTLKQEITRITTQIKKLNADISLTEKRIASTGLQIQELDEEIQTKESQIIQGKAAIADLLRSLQQSESTTLLEAMLMHNTISEFFSDIEQTQDVNATIKTRLDELRDLKTAQEEERTEQEEKKSALQDLESELGDRKKIHESSKSEQEVLLTQTKNKETAYQQLLSDREKKRQAVLDEIQRIEDELRKKIDPSTIPGGRSGVLGWPIEGATLTQGFGATPESKILYNGKPHNGIDVKASIGTPVLAAEDGIIQELGDTDAFRGCLSYGKWILVKHQNNLSTLYAHLSLIKASKGDTVKRGQLIAYSGSTGYATGPHLHFTVYDSATVQFKSSSVSGSTCKFLPYGGYLNPLAYL